MECVNEFVEFLVWIWLHFRDKVWKQLKKSVVYELKETKQKQSVAMNHKLCVLSDVFGSN